MGVRRRCAEHIYQLDVRRRVGTTISAGSKWLMTIVSVRRRPRDVSTTIGKVLKRSNGKKGWRNNRKTNVGQANARNSGETWTRRAVVIGFSCIWRRNVTKEIRIRTPSLLGLCLSYVFGTFRVFRLKFFRVYFTVNVSAFWFFPILCFLHTHTHCPQLRFSWNPDFYNRIFIICSYL